MKNIKYVVVALLGISLFSCEDAIDIIQPGELYEDTTFETVSDLEQGLMGVYPAITIDNEISFASIWTDECRIGVNNSGQGLNDGRYNFEMNTLTGAAASIWQSNYFLINFSNRLLRASKLVTVQPGEETKFNDIVAQAHILRAWGHFKLLSYYSTDLTDNNALGVILMDHVPSIAEAPGRSTNGEVFSLIEEDLDQQYVDALFSNNDNANRTYISPDFVKAFKARMYAYKGEYDKALPLAQELIDLYPLTPRTEYTKIWLDSPTLDSGNDEVIFRLERVSGDATIGSIWATNSSSPSTGGFVQFEMSTPLYNQFKSNSNPIDIRGNAFLDKAFPDQIYPIIKYKGNASQTLPMLNDAKIFRTSEMVFIKAEALAAAGDYAGVASALQSINAVRYSAPIPVIAVPATEAAAWAEILKQRSIELCYEGHRYLDLKRLAIKANVDIVRDPSDCGVNGACILANDSYKFTLPIPNVELQPNVTIRKQQNPGY